MYGNKKAKGYGAPNGGEENDNGKDAANGFSTEISFEISPQGYGGTDGDDTALPGKAKKVAVGIARTALRIGLEILIAKRTAKNDDEMTR